jgi:AcrR family transcriptional regulator
MEYRHTSWYPPVMPDSPVDPAEKARREREEAQRAVHGARRAADEARRSATELRASVRLATDGARDAGRATRQAASISGLVAASTRDAVRLAIDEARRAMKDVRVEVRVERRTREESRQQTRERLLDAAAEVFSRLGYHGASLEAVAEAAGYTKGAVYSNFATKGELFTALLQRYTERRVAEHGALMETVTLEELADHAGTALVQQQREQGTWDILQVEFWLAAMRDPALLALMSEGADDLYRESGAQFERKFAEAGLALPFSGPEFARLVNALGSGLLLQLYLEPDVIDASLFGRAIRALAGLPADSGASDAGAGPDDAGPDDAGPGGAD